METLMREMAGMNHNMKLNVLRGLMQCIGADGRATRPFLLMMVDASIEVPQSEIVKCILTIKREVAR